MNCQEVIELMHRDLDQDLSGEESERLHEHTQSCDSCFAMYERLKRLSNDLVQLPKVEPPYSIVDSIMPELDRIDQESKEEKQPAGTKFERFQRSASFKMMGGIAASVAFIILVASGSMFDWGKSAPETAQIADLHSAGSDGEPEMVPFMAFTEENESLNKRSMSEDAAVPDRDDAGSSDELAPSMNFMMMDPVPEMNQGYPSPDGNYTAHIVMNEHGRFIVEIVDQTGGIVFASAEMSVDAVGDVRWNIDSTQVEYTVYSEESSAQFLVDLSDK